MVSSPSTAWKRSFGDALAPLGLGRSSFAMSTARARKVERGMETLRVSWMRFWTFRTLVREMGREIDVDAGSSGKGIAGGASGFVSAFFSLGGAILMLLRSIWARCWIRLDCVEE